MLAALPVIAACLLIWIISGSKAFSNRRGIFVAAATAWGGLLVVVSEGLSIAGYLTRQGVCAAWLLTVAVLILLGGRTHSHVRPPRIRGVSFGALDRFDRITLTVMAIYIALLAILAVVAAPNNGDAMNYHMSRVEHWIHNGTLTHYPTFALYQLFYGPWAELVICHLRLLTNTDRFANCVQVFSMLGSLAVVSLIAKELGAGSRGSVTAMALAITLPSGILEASSTQNDYVLSFWLLSFVFFTMKLQETKMWAWSALAGGALGVAVLTKGTAYLFAAPFLAWVCLASAVSRDTRRLAQSGVIIAAAFLLNFGHYSRNYQVFGSPLGPSKQVSALVSERMSPATLVSNVLRNASLHLGTPFPKINAMEVSAISWIHSRLGMDVHDPRTAWARFEVWVPSSHESMQGNQLHFVLFAISSACLLQSEFRRRRFMAAYVASLVLGFAAFCVYLKWQPSGGRLQLPLFLLWAPVITVVMDRWPRQLSRIVVGVLLIAGIPWLLYGRNHRFLGSGNVWQTPRLEQYFVDSPQLEVPYLDAADFLRRRACTEVGVQLPLRGREYPLWVLLGGAAQQDVRIEHVGVDNASARQYGARFFRAFEPCAVIAVDRSPESIEWQGTRFHPALRSGPVTVYASEG